MVGRDDHGPAVQPGFEALAQPVAGRRVEMAPDLVEQHDVTVVEDRPRDRDPVALAGAERGAPLSDHRVETVAQAVEHLVETGDPGGGGQGRLSGIGVPEAQVVADGA